MTRMFRNEKKSGRRSSKRLWRAGQVFRDTAKGDLRILIDSGLGGVMPAALLAWTVDDAGVMIP